MDGEVEPDVILDHAIFNTLPRKNWFEASICSNEKLEKVSSGHLDLLQLHLPSVTASCADACDYFKLELPENLKDSSWFTKVTLARYLHLVNTPDLLKKTNAIQSELNQLEDTRKFHLTLYTKDKQSKFGKFPAESCCLNDFGVTEKDNLETITYDASKNELLRALDLRVTALNQELAAIFSQALGNNCSKNHLSNLIAFVEHFGASELRNSLVKYSALHFHSEDPDTSNEQSEILLHKLRNYDREKIVDVSGRSSQIDSKNSLNLGISPAKIAQAERQSSSESDESSDSSEEVQSFAERSRPATRSASPRRSASPMRRIQIGRSGSRRSTALAIKSLNYFPAREKPLFSREDCENNSESESSNQQPKRAENSGLRMSVQDRISMFESRQRETLNTQRRDLNTEGSFGGKKSVLRRWSAGMSDSSTPYTRENASDDTIELTSNNAEKSQDKLSAGETSDIQKPSCGQFENSAGSLEVLDTTSSPVDNPSSETPHTEETRSRTAASAEWTRQKEAELNQMLVQMKESKPASAKNTGIISGTRTYHSSKQKGNFYNQYKSKRDENFRLENAGKKVEKETMSKVAQGKVDNKKTFVPSKVTGPGGKQDSSACSQRTRRNSSPPVLAKASSPKPVVARKSSHMAPAPSAGRNSSPSIPSPRRAGTPPSRISSGMTTNNKTNHRKPQSTSSPTRAASQKERPRQLRGTRGSVTESKSNFKSKDEAKTKTTGKTSKSNKTKSIDPPGDDSSSNPAKPSFYNKVTKKSSVVPLESKPFLRKGSGISSGVGPASAKTKVIRPEDPLKNCGNVMQAEKEISPEAVEKMNEHHEDPLQAPGVDRNLEEPVGADLVSEKTQISESFVTEMEQPATQSVEIPVINVSADDELGISSSAWVDVDDGGDRASLASDLPQVTSSADAMPAALSCPRIRHSLSQMLQAESMEPEIIEWGNAEVPPALVYQKDAPKGLKRLLKFARKNKGELNTTDYFSPTVLSDGEEDTDEPRISNKNADTSLRKTAIKAKVTGIHRNMLSESYDGGNPSKGSVNHLSNHEFLSASMNGLPSAPDKLREGRSSAAASTSAKGTRSFFSLSTFRSNKSNEAKHR